MAKKNNLSEQWLSHPGFTGILRPPQDCIPPIEMIPLPEPEEPEYESPHGSVWIVAVAIGGRVTVLDTPNIHECLIENGPEPEDMGLPDFCEDLDPGIYAWTCSYHQTLDIYDGHVEDWHFEVEDEELLWSPQQLMA